MKVSYLISFLFVLGFAVGYADAATIKQTMDGAMDVVITFPDSVLTGRDFDMSILVQNNGWEDKQEVTFVVTSREPLIDVKNSTLIIERLSKGSSYGDTLRFTTFGVPPGTYYLNVFYSQVLLKDNQDPTQPFVRNIAIPIEIKAEPRVHLNTIVPSAIFSNAEFSFVVEIVSYDVDLRDVSVGLIPPEEVYFRGQSVHNFSIIQKGVPIQIHSQIVTPQEEVTYEHKIPFEVTVNYVDDVGQEKTLSKTVPVILRPRVFMELTTDGGIWLGGFFLAPYVSIGTLAAIPAGTLFSIFVHRALKKKGGKRQKNR